MKAKIMTADWKIALNHWFWFMFVFQFSINGFIFSWIINFLSINYYASSALGIIITPLVYMLGAITVSVFIKNKYKIVNKDEIIRLSTYLLVIVSGGAKIYSLVLVLFISRNWTSVYLTIMPLISFILGLFVFYHFGRKYIKN